MSRQQYVIAEKKRFSTRFIGILLVLGIFIFLFFPFYGLTLRYYIGSMVRKGLNVMGTICFTLGTFLIIVCFIALIVGRSIKVWMFVVAIVLLWVGCWCTDIVIDFFGITIGNSASSGSSGYH